MKGFLKDNSFPCRVFRNCGIMTQNAANKLSFFNVIRGTEEELRACRIFILVVRQFTNDVDDGDWGRFLDRETQLWRVHYCNVMGRAAIQKARVIFCTLDYLEARFCIGRAAESEQGQPRGTRSYFLQEEILSGPFKELWHGSDIAIMTPSPR